MSSTHREGFFERREQVPSELTREILSFKDSLFLLEMIDQYHTAIHTEKSRERVKTALMLLIERVEIPTKENRMNLIRALRKCQVQWFQDDNEIRQFQSVLLRLLQNLDTNDIVIDYVGNKSTEWLCYAYKMAIIHTSLRLHHHRINVRTDIDAYFRRNQPQNTNMIGCNLNYFDHDVALFMLIPFFQSKDMRSIEALRIKMGATYPDYIRNMRKIASSNLLYYTNKEIFSLLEESIRYNFIDHDLMAKIDLEPYISMINNIFMESLVVPAVTTLTDSEITPHIIIDALDKQIKDFTDPEEGYFLFYSEMIAHAVLYQYLISTGCRPEIKQVIVSFYQEKLSEIIGHIDNHKFLPFIFGILMRHSEPELKIEIYNYWSQWFISCLWHAEEQDVDLLLIGYQSLMEMAKFLPKELIAPASILLARSMGFLDENQEQADYNIVILMEANESLFMQCLQCMELFIDDLDDLRQQNMFQAVFFWLDVSISESMGMLNDDEFVNCAMIPSVRRVLRKVIQNLDDAWVNEFFNGLYHTRDREDAIELPTFMIYIGLASSKLNRDNLKLCMDYLAQWLQNASYYQLMSANCTILVTCKDIISHVMKFDLLNEREFVVILIATIERIHQILLYLPQDNMEILGILKQIIWQINQNLSLEKRFMLFSSYIYTLSSTNNGFVKQLMFEAALDWMIKYSLDGVRLEDACFVLSNFTRDDFELLRLIANDFLPKFITVENYQTMLFSKKQTLLLEEKLSHHPELIEKLSTDKIFAHTTEDYILHLASFVLPAVDKMQEESLNLQQEFIPSRPSSPAV